MDNQNVAIEYHWAEGHYDRLPALAAEIVRHQVAVIFASGGVPPARAAIAATATIPIVFNLADNPVERGLVASINRPGGNITGVNFLAAESSTKRLELLHDLVPKAAVMGLLVNPNSPTSRSEGNSWSPRRAPSDSRS